MTESKNTSGTATGSMGFASLLTLLFIGLKLTGNVDWSWWWVLSPIWISSCGVLLVLAIGLVFYLIGERRDRKRRGWM